MFVNYIEINFAPLAGLLFLLIFLFSNKGMDTEIRHTFLLLWFLEVVELFVYSAELWTASFAEPTVWRILLSAIGYGIRPLLVFCILRLNMHTRISGRRLLVLAIPAILNIFAAFSAFFTDIVYSYNMDNEFVRGPLAYVPHFVLLFYLVCILVVSMKREGENY